MDRLPELVAAYPRLFAASEFMALHSTLPAGWYGLMDQLCQRVTEGLAAEERFSVLQVQEKLGCLRIRYRGPERLFRLVDETCAASCRHCAACGAAIAKSAVKTALPLCLRHASPETR